MPSEDITKQPDFDEGALPGSKRQLFKLTVWWDLKHYRRYCKSEVGWPKPAAMCVCFPVAIGEGKAFIQSPFMITEKQYDGAVDMAKKMHYYAEVKWADKDPDINKWESELLEAFGAKAMLKEDGSLACNIIPVPDRVKGRFTTC